MILEAPGNPTLEPNPAASQVSPRGNCRGQSCADSPQGAPLAPTPGAVLLRTSRAGRHGPLLPGLSSGPRWWRSSSKARGVQAQ